MKRKFGVFGIPVGSTGNAGGKETPLPGIKIGQPDHTQDIYRYLRNETEHTARNQPHFAPGVHYSSMSYPGAVMSPEYSDIARKTLAARDAQISKDEADYIKRQERYKNTNYPDFQELFNNNYATIKLPTLQGVTYPSFSANVGSNSNNNVVAPPETPPHIYFSNASEGRGRAGHSERVDLNKMVAELSHLSSGSQPYKQSEDLRMFLNNSNSQPGEVSAWDTSKDSFGQLSKNLQPFGRPDIYSEREFCRLGNNDPTTCREFFPTLYRTDRGGPGANMLDSVVTGNWAADDKSQDQHSRLASAVKAARPFMGAPASNDFNSYRDTFKNPAVQDFLLRNRPGLANQSVVQNYQQ